MGGTSLSTILSDTALLQHAARRFDVGRDGAAFTSFSFASCTVSSVVPKFDSWRNVSAPHSGSARLSQRQEQDRRRGNVSSFSFALFFFFHLLFRKPFPRPPRFVGTAVLGST